MKAINIVNWLIHTHTVMQISVATVRTQLTKTNNYVMQSAQDVHKEHFNVDRVVFALAGILFVMDDQIVVMDQMKSVI